MAQSSYKPTEAKYESGAKEMYVTYDIEQETRGEGTSTYPKVKRVYVPGDLKDWEVGTIEKRNGRTVNGVKITYAKERESYTAERSGTEYDVSASETEYSKVVDVPDQARNVKFRKGDLPKKYEKALQDVA